LLPSFYVAIAALITGGFVLVGLSVFTWLRRPAIAGSAALPLVLAGSAVWVLAAAAEHSTARLCLHHFNLPRLTTLVAEVLISRYSGSDIEYHYSI
jgi:hypothetical protein